MMIFSNPMPTRMIIMKIDDNDDDSNSGSDDDDDDLDEDNAVVATRLNRSIGRRLSFFHDPVRNTGWLISIKRIFRTPKAND